MISPKTSLSQHHPARRLFSMAILSAFSPPRETAAPGGGKSYIVDGKMTSGFAVLASPVI